MLQSDPHGERRGARSIRGGGIGKVSVSAGKMAPFRAPFGWGTESSAARRRHAPRCQKKTRSVLPLHCAAALQRQLQLASNSPPFWHEAWPLHVVGTSTSGYRPSAVFVFEHLHFSFEMSIRSMPTANRRRTRGRSRRSLKDASHPRTFRRPPPDSMLALGVRRRHPRTKKKDPRSTCGPRSRRCWCPSPSCHTHCRPTTSPTSSPEASSWSHNYFGHGHGPI